jgi:transcription-repair coupling factor (superfamily II helicase)
MIPEPYVRDLPVRLGLYRRIGGLQTEAEIEAMGAELADRFGPAPPEVENLLQVVWLKALCRQVGVDKLDVGPKGIVLGFRGNRFANPAGLVQWVAAQGGGVKLRPDHKVALAQEMPFDARIRAARELLQALVRVVREPNAPPKPLLAPPPAPPGPKPGTKPGVAAAQAPPPRPRFPPPPPKGAVNRPIPFPGRGGTRR